MKTKKIKLLVIIIVVLLFAGLSGWFAKSIWDSVFYLHGRVHVVNTLPVKVTVSVTFPSGENREFILNKSQSKNLYIRNTGEGSIKVAVDNKEIECGSYVTSLNPLIVITITKDEAIVTAIYNNKNL